MFNIPEYFTLFQNFNVSTNKLFFKISERESILQEKQNTQNWDTPSHLICEIYIENLKHILSSNKLCPMSFAFVYTQQIIHKF